MEKGKRTLLEKGLEEKVLSNGKFLIAVTYIDQDDMYQHHIVRRNFPIEEMRRSHRETGKLIENEIRKVLAVEGTGKV